ncbi:hypothetical protein D3C84_585680 [compost metagenome]
MKKLLYSILFIPLVAASAPSQQDKDEISNIVERSGQNLGGLIECDRQDLQNEYVAVLRDALGAYPGTDPVKVRALIRGIERQGEIFGRLGIKGIPSPTAEDLERQAGICKWQIADAKRDMRTMDNFILK